MELLIIICVGAYFWHKTALKIKSQFDLLFFHLLALSAYVMLFALAFARFAKYM